MRTELAINDLGAVLDGSLPAATDLAAGAVVRLDEEGFRFFYDRTARPLWAYLCHLTGNSHQADDLLQESYYRLLKAGVAWESEAHCRHYLFRIATNLVRDGWRRRSHEVALSDGLDDQEPATDPDIAGHVARREDLRRALGQLKPRERQLLWLAYAEGSSHREIAGALGLSAGSIRQLLLRARRKLARFLTGSEGGDR